ncbi:MAG TPA: response regulator transcription factor [Opitutaceae bacterium]|jgi:two-component system response regulator DevR|nr:response regulator transcription factor [Opitutaceae bacterium]
MTNTRTPIRILIVDDSELVRRGIKTVLAAHSQSPLRVVGEAGTAAAAVAETARLKPDIVLLDIRLPDGSGFNACREILRSQPDTRVVVLTSVSSDNFIYEAITSGAQGYLLKEIDPAGLVQALIDVADGKSILDPDTTARVMRLVRAQSGSATSEDLASLSPQERRVLALVAEGKTNKEVGERLGLSDNTVKNYLGSVFEKLHIKRRSQAAALYVQNTPSKQ